MACQRSGVHLSGGQRESPSTLSFQIGRKQAGLKPFGEKLLSQRGRRARTQLIAAQRIGQQDQTGRSKNSAAAHGPRQAGEIVPRVGGGAQAGPFGGPTGAIVSSSTSCPRSGADSKEFVRVRESFSIQQ